MTSKSFPPGDFPPSEPVKVAAPIKVDLGEVVKSTPAYQLPNLASVSTLELLQEVAGRINATNSKASKSAHTFVLAAIQLLQQ